MSQDLLESLWDVETGGLIVLAVIMKGRPEKWKKRDLSEKERRPWVLLTRLTCLWTGKMKIFLFET